MTGALRSLALIAALALAGCSSSSEGGRLAEVLNLGGGTDGVPAGFAPRFVPLATQSPLPPALQVAIIEQDLASTVLLEMRRDGVDTWLTPDGATLTTRDGFLLATRGFGQGLLASDITQPRAMVLAGQAGLSERFHTYLTGNDETVTRTYRCMIENRGARILQIGGDDVPVRLMAEDCRSLDQSFLNLYWVSTQTNRVLQTRQWAGEFLGVLTTRVVLN